jgi:lysophospholipase L1-like esterase
MTRLLLAAALALAIPSSAVDQAASPASPASTQTSQSPAPSPSSDQAKLQADLDQARQRLQDWPQLSRYHADNATVPLPALNESRVVFLGDSITDSWGRGKGQFFPGKPYINRGISGQTTPQMLIRIRPDVIALKPKVMVLLAGTNDLAGNTGPMTLDMIEDNIMSISELAKVNGIRVVLASVLPVCDYIKPQTERRPPQKIVVLNEWLKGYAAGQSFVYLDYFDAMVDGKGMLKQELTFDCLHPNDAGYSVMQPLAENAIAQTLRMN